MMLRGLLLCLVLLITPFTGVCSKKPKNVTVKTNEMVALWCPLHTEADSHSLNLVWIHHGAQATVLSGMSPGEQRLRGVLVHGKSLVILNATVNHQGNYSCSARNASGQSWFSLTVDMAQTYSFACYKSDSCIIKCPKDKTPGENIPGLTTVGITWHKVGERSPMSGYFNNVKEENGGDYTCTRHYRRHGQLYNMTFTVQLDVDSKTEKSTRLAAIISPRKGEVFHVHLGSPLVVHCKAVMYFYESESLFWLNGDDGFVGTEESLPVFFNSTSELKSEGFEITASLVIRDVSEADLLQNYTCKLDTFENTESVNIRLDKKPSPPPPCYISLALSIVCVVLFLAFVVIVYAKFKVPVVLFLRDTLGCHRSSSGGKSYDAFVMYYQSDTDAGLNEPDRRFLEIALEERLGYRLCLYDRDVLPGNAAADSVLDCVEQSRAVVLVPTSSDSCLESGLLIAIHATLVERRTRLVFIQTDAEQRPCRGSVPEGLQLLAEAGDRVMWKGSGSVSLSSSFWKRLRYYLPAPRDVKKTTSDKSRMLCPE